mgnify:CR=1 FL=1
MLTLLWRALDVGWVAGLFALFPAIVVIAPLVEAGGRVQRVGRFLPFGVVVRRLHGSSGCRGLVSGAHPTVLPGAGLVAK